MEDNSNISHTLQNSSQRWFTLVLDYSEQMLELDRNITRLSIMILHVIHFIKSYTQLNPVSQIQILSTSNGLSKIVSRFSGDPELLISNLKESVLMDEYNKISQKDVNHDYLGVGHISLQNSLQLAYESYKHLPHYGNKEILFITGSLVTQDPGNVLTIFRKVKEEGIVVNMIHLSSEVYIFKNICEITGGNYSVILNEKNFLETLNQYCISKPPTIEEIESIKSQCGISVGFPIIHSTFLDCKFLTECPRCLYKMEGKSFPTTCQSCSLLLLQGIHQTRWRSVIYSIPKFIQIYNVENFEQNNIHCYSCEFNLDETNNISNLPIAHQCPHCKKLFCDDCNKLIHEALNECPGCTDEI